MFFFGHIGITAGAAKACDIFLSRAKSGNIQELNYSSKITPAAGRKWFSLYPLLSRINSRIDPIDYRMVLVGSILPDMIDKPVFLIAGGAVSLSGRDYAHTLLFNLVLLIGGLILIKYKRSWLLVISLSSFMHLVLDQMWTVPVVLLWPLLGPLPSGEIGALYGIFDALFSVPGVYIPETIGLVIILLFAFRLVKRKRVFGFIKDGAID